MLFNLDGDYKNGIKLITKVEKIAAENYFRAEGIRKKKTSSLLPKEITELVASFALGKCDVAEDEINYDKTCIAARGEDFFAVE